MTVATSRNCFPELGRLGTNFDTKSRLIATNQNKIATRASPEAYDAWLLNHKICPDKYGGVRMAEK